MNFELKRVIENNSLYTYTWYFVLFNGKVTFSDLCLEVQITTCLLTHWGRVTHICQHQPSLVQKWSAPSHYLNQCWNIVDWTLANKLQWNLNRNLYSFVQVNAFEIVVRKLAAILSWPQCVNTLGLMIHSGAAELGDHWFRWWVVTDSVPSHYLYQCRLCWSSVRPY